MNPDDDPLEQLKALKTGGAPDPLDELKALKPKPHDYHAEFKSGALQQRMQGANARDVASAKEEDAAQPGYVERGLTHVLNAAQGIPGMEAVEAEAGRQGSTLTDHPMDYTTSLQRLRERTGQIGGKTSFAEHVMGGLATLPFLPENGAAAGATLGAADQLFAADPDRGKLERVARGAGGAAVGGVVGKTAEMAGPWLRSLKAKSTPANLIARDAARKESANEMYSASINANKGMPLPDEATAFLAHPDVAPIKDRLLSMDLGLKPDSPELFDAVYKALSDQEKVAQKGLAVAEPGKPNMGRATLTHLGALKEKFMKAATQPGTRKVTTEIPEVRIATAQTPPPSTRDALRAFQERSAEAARRAEGGAAPNANPFSSQASGETVMQKSARESLERRHAEASVPAPKITGKPTVIPARTETRAVPSAPPLPGYGEAVQDYARRSADIKGVERGSDALNNAVSSGKVAGKNLVKKSREGFSQWAADAEPSQRQAASEGILGNLKDSQKLTFGHVLGTPFVPKPSPEMSAAPDLLRRVQDPTQAAHDLLVKLGLITGNAAIQ